jgi:uncharacterized delta-60 repeat protein
MWFSSSRKTRRGSISRSLRGGFRPQLEALEDRCLLSAGALDPTFGGPFNGSNSPAGTVVGPTGFKTGAGAIIIYPNTGTNLSTDGKIVLGGFQTVTSKNTETNIFALARYDPFGGLDLSFGKNGIATANVSYSVGALALQGDKLIAVGGGSSNFVVTRFTSTGQLDSTFGTGGIVQTHVTVPGVSSTSSEAAHSVIIQGDGKICVAGIAVFTVGKGKNSESASDFALVRYNADGSLDMTFGVSGTVVTPNIGGGSADNQSPELALQSDGKIVLAGITDSVSPSAMAVVRYTSNGLIDSSLGASGILTLTPPGRTNAGAYGVFIQGDGRIVLSGFSRNGAQGEQTLARLASNGTIDTSFGTSGFTINPSLMNGHNVVQAANGDLLTSGTAGVSGNATTSDFGLAAYLPSGALDPSFGVNGTSIVAITSGQDEGIMLALQNDGKIVVGGFSNYFSTGSGALARFLPSNTQIGWPTATPNPVLPGTNVTLTFSNIYDNAYPSTTVTQVSFYQDTNGNGILDSTDLLLGTGTLSTLTGVWNFTFSTSGLSKGTYTLFAQATDGSMTYDPVSIQVTVN